MNKLRGIMIANKNCKRCWGEGWNYIKEPGGKGDILYPCGCLRPTDEFPASLQRAVDTAINLVEWVGYTITKEAKDEPLKAKEGE